VVQWSGRTDILTFIQIFWFRFFFLFLTSCLWNTCFGKRDEVYTLFETKTKKIEIFYKMSWMQWNLQAFSHPVLPTLDYHVLSNWGLCTYRVINNNYYISLCGPGCSHLCAFHLALRSNPHHILGKRAFSCLTDFVFCLRSIYTKCKTKKKNGKLKSVQTFSWVMCTRQNTKRD